MSESEEKNNWDRERIEEIVDLIDSEVVRLETVDKLVELLGSVRAEAVGWTWTVACNHHDRGMDPRNYEVPQLLEEANADLNPNKE